MELSQKYTPTRSRTINSGYIDSEETDYSENWEISCDMLDEIQTNISDSGSKYLLY